MLRPTLDNTLGSAFIGNILAACLFGLTTLQTYTYYGRSRGDVRTLKVLVGVLWILDVVHVALLTQTVYQYAVTDYGQLLSLTRPTTTVRVLTLITGISDFLVRCVYCSRIWLLSGRNRILLTIVSVASLVALGSVTGKYSRYIIRMPASSLTMPATGVVVMSLECTTFFEIDQRIAWLIFMGLGTASLADVLISITMCILLARGRKEDLTHRLDNTVRSLQLYIIHTGVATSLCAILSLAMYAIGPTTMLYLIMFFILPKVFLNAMLAMLNARKSLRDQMVRRVVSVHPSPAFPFEIARHTTGSSDTDTRMPSSVMMKDSLIHVHGPERNGSVY
ncbi:hypothetical protein C8Q74DRAFT_1367947 [Fomes fomentarius]|nr:hypothetical protein C8Q74DRAFT_1367947 [Fomes fomentarius]